MERNLFPVVLTKKSNKNYSSFIVDYGVFLEHGNILEEIKNELRKKLNELFEKDFRIPSKHYVVDFASEDHFVVYI